MSAGNSGSSGSAHFQGLQKRIATGVLGGALLIATLIYGGRLGSALLAVLFSFGMLYEFIEINFHLPDKTEKKILLLGLTWLVSFANFWMPRTEYVLLLFLFFILFTYFLFTAEKHEGPALTLHFQELMFSLFGCLYLTFLPLYLVLIRDSANGLRWVLLFFLLNWAGDTAAYFVGIRYGKKKLYPKISPKKTVVGSLGGLGSGIVLTLLYKFLFFRGIPWLAILIIPLVVGCSSQLGDLCESFLKRAFGRKDSGTILPGHGGFLDRFDGVVFSLPLMYACIRIFGS